MTLLSQRPGTERRTTRILFVDDDPAVLDGIRRSLYHCRRNWDMVFAASGEQGLKLLREGRFDVIVTDMDMPRVDGLRLLLGAKLDHPETIRIVLSAHARYESLATTSFVHAYLRKPCGRDRLQETIERLCADRRP